MLALSIFIITLALIFGFFAVVADDDYAGICLLIALGFCVGAIFSTGAYLNSKPSIKEHHFRYDCVQKEHGNIKVTTAYDTAGHITSHDTVTCTLPNGQTVTRTY